MLKDYTVDNFSDKRELALLCMRQSIWNRQVRDYLLPDAYYRTYKSFEEMTGGKHSLTVETTHRILNSSSRSAGDEGEKDAHAKAARWLCDAMDFRELCRIFGERFAAVNAFEIKSEYDFSCREGGRGRAANAGNVLSYVLTRATGPLFMNLSGIEGETILISSGILFRISTTHFRTDVRRGATFL